MTFSLRVVQDSLLLADGLDLRTESPQGNIDGVEQEFSNGRAGSVSASVSIPNLFVFRGMI
jgi:hypothetical protein